MLRQAHRPVPSSVSYITSNRKSRIHAHSSLSWLGLASTCLTWWPISLLASRIFSVSHLQRGALLEEVLSALAPAAPVRVGPAPPVLEGSCCHRVSAHELVEPCVMRCAWVWAHTRKVAVVAWQSRDTMVAGLGPGLDTHSEGPVAENVVSLDMLVPAGVSSAAVCRHRRPRPVSAASVDSAGQVERSGAIRLMAGGATSLEP